jgi:hypothetical protein
MRGSTFAGEQRDRAGDDPNGPPGDMQKQDQVGGGEEPPGTSCGDVKSHVFIPSPLMQKASVLSSQVL